MSKTAAELKANIRERALRVLDIKGLCMIEIGMTIQEAAKELNGREYGDELPEGFEKVLKENNLLAIFGYSDDLTEFRGAFSDETGHGVIRLTKTGIPESDCHEGQDCPYFAKLAKHLPFIETDFEDGFTVKTTLPHAKFKILEDGEPYGEGIVIYTHELPHSI
jgi:hypothetical protein